MHRSVIDALQRGDYQRLFDEIDREEKSGLIDAKRAIDLRRGLIDHWWRRALIAAESSGDLSNLASFFGSTFWKGRTLDLTAERRQQLANLFASRTLKKKPGGQANSIFSESAEQRLLRAERYAKDFQSGKAASIRKMFEIKQAEGGAGPLSLLDLLRPAPCLTKDEAIDEAARVVGVRSAALRNFMRGGGSKAAKRK